MFSWCSDQLLKLKIPVIIHQSMSCMQIPGVVRGGGLEPHEKRLGMLIILPRGVNQILDSLKESRMKRHRIFNHEGVY